jgi:hypothetical protein
MRRILSINEKIILKNWLGLTGTRFPSADEISYLACQTKMSKSQIRKWFINNKNRSAKKNKIINFEQEKILKLFYMKKPYPSENDVQWLIKKTLLSRKKLSQWFRHRRLKKAKNLLTSQ